MLSVPSPAAVLPSPLLFSPGLVWWSLTGLTVPTTAPSGYSQHSSCGEPVWLWATAILPPSPGKGGTLALGQAAWRSDLLSHTPPLFSRSLFPFGPPHPQSLICSGKPHFPALLSCLSVCHSSQSNTPHFSSRPPATECEEGEASVFHFQPNRPVRQQAFQ